MLLTALFPKLAQPAFSYFIQDDLPTCGITHNDLDSPIPFTNQENALQTYLEASFMKKMFWIKIHLYRWTPPELSSYKSLLAHESSPRRASIRTTELSHYITNGILRLIFRATSRVVVGHKSQWQDLKGGTSLISVITDNSNSHFQDKRPVGLLQKSSVRLFQLCMEFQNDESRILSLCKVGSVNRAFESHTEDRTQ